MKKIMLVVVSLLLCMSTYGKERVVDYLQDRNDLKYEVNQEEPFTGKLIKYWASGQKKFELPYKDGKLHGLVTEWYENGQKKSERSYKDDKDHGLAAGWYESSQKKYERPYKNGKEHGLVTAWYENGQKWLETNYKAGKKYRIATGKSHTHAGRSHTHPLPAQGIAHRHGNGALAKEEAQKIDRAKNIRPVNLQRDHIRGNKNAPITIIEYSDYECPFCKRFHTTVNKLLENNPKKIRWVFRHFPLELSEPPGGTRQAEAAECVAVLAGNDGFWKYSDLMYKRTSIYGGDFSLRNLKPLAVEIGVDAGKFESCFSRKGVTNKRVTNKVKKDIENGKRLGIKGTPAAFILNKKGDMEFVNGAYDLKYLQSIVNKLDK